VTERVGATPALAGPPLPLNIAPLVADADAHADRFSFRGRAGIDGHARHGLETVTLDSVTVARALEVRFGDAGHTAPAVRISGLGVERQCDVGGRTLTERVAPIEESCAALIEWVLGQNDAPLDLHVEWDTDIDWRADGRLLRDNGAGPAGTLRLCILSETPREWCGIGGRIGFDVTLRPGQPFRLAFAAVSAPADTRNALRALQEPAAAVRARAAWLRRLRDARASIGCSSAAVRPSFEWAKFRLMERTADGPLESGNGAALTLAAARLAIGEVDPAREAIARHLETDGGTNPTDPSACLLMASLYHAWTGDHDTLREWWPRLQAVLERCAAGADPLGLRAAALREFAVAAEALGPPVQHRVVHASRRAVAGLSPSQRPAGPAGPALSILAGLRDGTSEAGALADVTGEWLRRPAPPEDESAAAAVIISLVHDLLRADPDAPRHRLRLRPRIPESWNDFELRNLAVGDAIVAMRFARAGTRFTFDLEQSGGPVPLRIVFEPAITAATLRSAEVDGVAASLQPKLAAGGLVVPVQLILDHGRTIVLECGDAP
jgi:hypothetical protein